MWAMSDEENKPAAYGGRGYQPRRGKLLDEIGSYWGRCGANCEWAPLEAVMLHRPGEELAAIASPDEALMFETLDLERAQAQHDALVAAFLNAGVQVHLVEPEVVPPPNLMFAADLFFMTPEGAILGRPAAEVRAGEERHIARKLAELGIPILRSIRGSGTFEGADAAWLDPHTVLLSTGLRTNPQGADQVEGILAEMGVRTVRIQAPPGTMHLMGQLRFLGPRLAVGWPGRVPPEAEEALRVRGIEIKWMPDQRELALGMGMNFVTLEQDSIIMPASNPRTLAFLELMGVCCMVVEVDELAKAAGGIGCLTGILERNPISTDDD
jgi:N-dimethylarginine dimethylaminohydrolase